MEAVSILKVEKKLPVFKAGEPANAIEVIRLCDENGDSLEFNIIAGKGLNEVGDYGLYIMPDYNLSERNEFMEYLAPGGDPSKCKLGKGNRIKAIKFNFSFDREIDPIYSNGIFINLKFLPEFDHNQNLQDFFGITKYVAADNAESMKSGLTKGELPDFLYATDETRCLSEDTLVNTNVGIITIKELSYRFELGEKLQVLSYNIENDCDEFKDVQDSLVRNNNNDWFEIELTDGKKIKATSNHPFYLPVLNCYRQVKDLKDGDIVKIKK